MSTDQQEARRENRRWRGQLRPRHHRRRPGQQEARRPRRHALPARAERLPAHRPRQGDLRRLRPGAGVRRHLQPALRRHQPDHRGRRVRRGHPGGHPLARLRVVGAVTTPRTTSRSSTSWPMKLIEKDKRLRRQPDRRADPRVPRRLLQEGRSPARTATGPIAESLDLFKRMRAGEFPEGAHVLRGEDRSRDAEHEHARSGAVPDPVRAPPPHRQEVVHLPDVRLRAPAVGRDREDHALDLHAGVRVAPAALRLVHPGDRDASRRGRSSSRA